jgi:phosphoenolpyruvate---glycerone phosphotransferase subunit DhaL
MKAMETLKNTDVVELLAEMAKLIIASRDDLNELDGKLGDADFGTSICGGFAAVQILLPELGGLAPGMIFGKTGMTLVKSMGGASGPLFGTLFMKAGKELGDRQEIGTAELAAMLSAGLAGVKALGKSNAGDKTLIDALEPATLAIAAAAERGESLPAALAAARAAAAQGVEATKQMIASRGRAFYVGERGLGHPDAGATAIAMLFAVFDDFVQQAHAR